MRARLLPLLGCGAISVFLLAIPVTGLAQDEEVAQGDEAAAPASGSTEPPAAKTGGGAGKPAPATEPSTEKKGPSATKAKARKRATVMTRPLPHWLFTIGLFGGAASEADVTAPEGHTPHEGETTGVDLVVSRVNKGLMLDLGLGFSLTKLRGKEPFPGDGRPVRTTISTNAVLLRTGARYKLWPYFGVGANLSQWYSPDLSFSSYETSPKTGTFFGLTIDFWLPLNHKQIGLGFAYEMDLTIPKRRITFATAHLSFALPLTPPERRLRRKKDASETTTGEAVGFVIVRSIFDERVFVYADETAVRPSSKTEEFLKDLAAATLAVRSDYRGMVVRIAVPERDGEEDNAKTVAMAKERAEFIKQAFIAAGHPAAGLKSAGLTSKKLGEGKLHVEFNFVNVKNGKRLDNVIEGVRAKYGIIEPKP